MRLQDTRVFHVKHFSQVARILKNSTMFHVKHILPKLEGRETFHVNTQPLLVEICTESGIAFTWAFGIF